MKANQYTVATALVVALTFLPLFGCKIDPSQTNGPGEYPIADAGEDQTVQIGTTVVLDGSGSSDPDGDSLEFTWRFTEVAPGSVLRNDNIEDADQDVAYILPDTEGNYELRLTVSDGQFEAKDTVRITVTFGAPDVPTGLAVIDQRSSSISLIWNGSSHVEGYQVYRDTQESGAYATEIYDGSETSFTDSDLAVNTTYFYKVRATNLHGSSALSGAVSGFTNPDIPLSPTGLAVTDQTNSAISLSWDACDGATSYQVYRDSSQFGDFSSSVYDDDATSFTDTDLDPETTFWYKVRATNSTGSSQLSAGASGTTAPDPPETPAGLSVDGQTDTSVILVWDSASRAESYQVYRYNDQSGLYDILVHDGPALTCEDTGLVPETSYWYKVQASNVTGSSALSLAVTGTTDAANPYLANLTVSVGTMAPSFQLQRSFYTVTVHRMTESITVTPTTDDPSSTIEVEGSVVASGVSSAPVSLATGTTEINIDVTAGGGSVTEHYVINVCRPAIHLARTGQTISYSSGDDGDLQMGVAWPATRFTDNGNGTMTDNLTGLMWEQDPYDPEVTWSEALTYANDRDLGGHTDWRVPNIVELDSLTNTGQWTSDYLNAQGFISVPSRSHFASTSITSSSAYTTHMAATIGTQGKNNPGVYVIIVRGASDVLPATGQTTVWETGDDGTYQLGCSIPSPRFVDNGDGTVLDNLTGLMWEQSPTSTDVNWQGALDYANGLDLAGHTDWRLPNRSELASLYNFTVSDQATWLTTGGNPFMGVDDSGDYYWTGTAEPLNTARKYCARFNWPVVGRYEQSDSVGLHAWAVRGGYQ